MMNKIKFSQIVHKEFQKVPKVKFLTLNMRPQI